MSTHDKENVQLREPFFSSLVTKGSALNGSALAVGNCHALDRHFDNQNIPFIADEGLFSLSLCDKHRITPNEHFCSSERNLLI